MKMLREEILARNISCHNAAVIQGELFGLRGSRMRDQKLRKALLLKQIVRDSVSHADRNFFE